MTTKELDIVVKLRDAASRGLKSVRSNVTGMGKAASTASKGLKSMYAQLAAIAAIVAGGALLGGAIKQFAAFDDNMRAAGAVMSATREEMELLTQAAKDMGATTRYTSAQAAEALKFLGMAGFEATEAVEALPGVLQLATAGALDLGVAADITSNVLSAFGLEVENLGQVNDVLVKTFTSANVNLQEIGEAFKIVGPIAKGVGANFEDLVGTIGALGNAGIKGTLAGTALKGTIGALLNPTRQESDLLKGLENRLGGVALKIKDADGDFVGFRTILEQLEKAGLRGDEALKLFGERAGPGMAALLNMGSDELGNLIDKLDNAGGTSKEIADKMEEGLGGQIRKTTSLLQALVNQIGETFGPATIAVLKEVRVWMQALLDEGQLTKYIETVKMYGDWMVKIMGWVGKAVQKTWHAISALTSVTLALGFAITGNFDAAKAALDGFMDHVDKVVGEAKDPSIVSKPITEQMRKGLEAAKGPIGKGAKKLGAVVAENVLDPVTWQAKLKAAMVRLDADLKQESVIIESKYKEGLISLDAYYNERAELVRRKVAAEIEILKKRLSSENDIDKKEILNAQIYAKESSLQTSLLQLEADKASAQASLDQQRLKEHEKILGMQAKAEKAYADQQARIKEGDGVTTLDAQFADELSKLQTKQNDELALVKTYHEALLAEKVRLKASEAELEAADAASKAAIDAQTDAQAEEKAQLIADQALRTREYQLQNLEQLAGGTAQIFDQLYELTGKKQKEFFYLSKAAAIAQATMNIAQGVTKALAQGGVYGMVTGAIVAASGAIQIGTILGQTLAEGGEVLGTSPHAKADNIPAMLTAEEYVQPVSAVRHYGKGVMEALRTRSIPKGLFAGYASGGYVKSGRSHFADGGLVAGTPGSGGKPGGGRDQAPNIVNVLDPSVFEQYTASEPGKRNILNVMSENIFEVKQMLSQS